MRVDELDFHLPPDLIAQYPAEPADSARLLEVRPESLGDFGVRDLPRLLAPGDLLVFNDTRVIPARLAGRRDAVRVEVTLHKPEAGEGMWAAFARPAKRLRHGQTIAFGGGLSAEVRSKRPGGEVVLAFDRGGAALLAALEAEGTMPLPPYIRGGEAEPADRARYQTRFAEKPGAVAAPTAALHFTERLMAELEAAGIGWTTLTLHVGAGTFLPVKVEDTADHVMHAERGAVEAATAERVNAARAAGGRIVAVGTTSLRLLETAADPTGVLHPWSGETDIFITPGYRFRAA
ncbi:MAG: tRNA preQ1(34) S-adenosylmethionine ribosyltransferase-isomerase QueA, partial [Gemmatimonadetes bacterium]|nr:tRNA preQ1(34) S-adenosylmethionine ribosyltransferase-isomerase QueA [Gemmatimonadota bacterium]NIQ59082.1 tRNA preQ1(34) S-adenosylmethionine ribosyltransferase-isomerase QueA [Gemmatimonadota bacterium]NIU79285.1 tRNA preQ1(34) S-adenosylmethionine ribosyltransferase-isomerase QueA [Gammaproteobacteria bacterium]NIX47970.1 tRNA preQ1(34) S-adenosylmethionine ribosyltransferase-isomerase QueA [Gemmatimonadota bacterium]NIY12334.1 tRNA preQ1(34) S-adenosylmethionine ribosyltransferase-isome